MPIKCDVTCDHIVTYNLIDVTSKNSILIKEKITLIETYKITTILKIMSLVLQVKIFHIMLSILKYIYMGCDFPKKNVLKLFNDTNKNEEHLNKIFQLMKENLASTKKKKP